MGRGMMADGTTDSMDTSLSGTPGDGGMTGRTGMLRFMGSREPHGWSDWTDH